MLSLGDARFELIREVGAGAFGVVYQAIDHLSGNQVAVKLLKRERDDAARFEREVAALAGLSHPHIVQYVSHGRTPSGENYLVMEWLEGAPLEQRLTQGTLSVAETLSLSRCVVSGLALTEQLGLVHRDLKPANIFLVGGKAVQAKVLDFGLARRSDEAQSLTRTGATVGTPLYMSPEQAQGRRALDSRSDVFALGSMLYECLAGSAPFEGASPLSTLARICIEEPERIESRRPEVPARFAKLLHAMLSKATSARPTFRRLDQELTQITPTDAPGTRVDARPATRSTSTSGLRARQRPRVLCAVFLGHGEDDVTPAGELETDADGLPVDEFERSLERLQAAHDARCQRLLDGSRILLIEQREAPADLVIAGAQLALSLRSLRKDAPIALCFGRAVLDGSLPVGEVMARGAALLAAAPAGAVLADVECAALLEARFELRIANGGRVIERERSLGEAPRTLLGKSTPFVGRELELARLSECCRVCVDERRARAAVVIGPAGSGKSRLRYELVQRLSGKRRFELMIGRGDESRTGTPFGVIAPALRAVSGIHGNDPLEVRRKKLRGRVASVLPEERASVAAQFLGEMVGVPFPDEASAHLAAARRDPQLMGDSMLTSWLEWIEAECSVQPLLLCVEDLHWADAASVRFIEAALRALHDKPLMVLALARPELSQLFPGVWADRDPLQLTLDKLAARDCEALLDAVAGAELSDALRARLLERADGNPFYLEELLRGLKAGGADSLPDTIVGMIQARLDAVGEQAKLLVRAASVFGQVFPVEGMRALLGMDAYRIDVAGWLRTLHEREVLFPRAEADGKEYVFRHGLIRDAAYDLIPDDEKTFGHRMAGEWLERHGPCEPALLAAHFEKGQVLARAAHWYKVAAGQALEASSLSDVLKFGERAVECGIDGEPLGELAAAVAEALSYQADQAGAAAWGEEARQHLRPASQGWWRACQVAAIADLRLGQGQIDAIVDEMVTCSRGPSMTPEQTIAVASVASECLLYVRRELGQRLLKILPQEVPAALRGRPEGFVMVARSFLANSESQLGSALQYARDSVDAFRAAGAGRDVATMLNNLGSTLLDVGANDDAERCLRECLELATRLGVTTFALYAKANIGTVQRRRGSHAEARRIFSELADEFARRELPSYRGTMLRDLALASLDAEDVDGALPHAREAVDLTAGDPGAHAAALAALSQIELRRGELARAHEHASKAAALMREHGLVDDMGCVHMAYLEVLLRGGMREESERARDAARDWLEERANRLRDPDLRASFLRQVPEHRRIVELVSRGEG